MANLILSDILQTVRYLANEPSNQGRFADAELINYINLACVQTMLKVEWPEASLFWTSDGIHGGQWKELQLPELYSVNRVYVAGQLCVPTSIPILEGDGIQAYDQSTSTYTPQWTAAPFTGYPVASYQGSPSGASLPYFQGQRPGYYFRGGALGITPPPASGYVVGIDIYPMPVILANYQDQTFFPQLFKDALANRALTYAYFADDSDEGNSRSVVCMKNFDMQCKEVLIPWRSKFERNLPNQPMPTPHRTYFNGPWKGPTGVRSRFGG